MDPPAGRRAGPCRPQIANRPKTMFRASLSKTFLGPERPALGRPAPQPRIAAAQPVISTPRRRSNSVAFKPLIPRITPARFVFDVALTCVVVDPALASPVLRRRALRLADMGGTADRRVNARCTPLQAQGLQQQAMNIGRFKAPTNHPVRGHPR